ncbi:mechanosensitive ion channel domain-containing protein [Marinobacter caseinilyticus]|uniref:mechanosensitive ion channel domain-containing protein n=1 Tax=Marinobacter caseinilyticus TaxID=2692195 RepID=UPI001A9471AF|nr:mechanosensitive ion channel domain-containing protein [Marinobacter caseinilyticus]
MLICTQGITLSRATLWLFALLLLSMLAAPVLAAELTEEPAQKPEEAPAKMSAADSEKPTPQASLPAVQPEIKEEISTPLNVDLPSASTAGIRQQIQSLRTAVDQRLSALEASRGRLSYAETLLNRLNDEYQSFELRLERAGLNLTDEYASLLRQRLNRLERQSIADSLTAGINEKLSAAREAQLRLEEFEAIVTPEQDPQGQLRRKRADLLRQLHKGITQHIDVLNEYFNTVGALQLRVEAYKKLLLQRLFWLPSTAPVSWDTFAQLYRAAVWAFAPQQWSALIDSIKPSVLERRLRITLLVAVLLLLLYKRRTLCERLIETGASVGNVRHDRFASTVFALGYSLLLAVPGVLVLATTSLMLMEGSDFIAALSKGMTVAAFILFLLSLVHQVARKNGLGERHFKWNATTLEAIRREIPILLMVLIPIAILSPAMATEQGAQYQNSLGRTLFTVASIALAVFAHRIMGAVRTHHIGQFTLKSLHGIAVATPLLLAVASWLGYHYTAVQLERNLFVSLCWLAFIILLYYLGLRELSVRERRMTLERLREQRAADRKLAEARESAEFSGEGLPQALDMPEMDLKDINLQSTSLLRMIAFALAIAGLWALWAEVIPALQLFDNMTLWTITTGLEGGDPLPITLGDLLLSLILATATLLAARNLPGTLEVMILSRMNLEPGSGYAVTTMVKYLIVIIGVTASLAVLGLQWSKLQWLIAALGVGLGFGLQEIVANFVSGIILLFERPIRVGDTVTIDGITGTVSRIRIRATTLVDWDRKEQIIPNKTLVTQDLTNWTLSDPITRVIIKVGVAYGSDVDAVQDILVGVAEANDRVVSDPAPAVFCVGLGDSSIDFEIRAFIDDVLDYMPLSHELHAAITTALRDAGIQIPFPQRDIHVRTMIEPHPSTEQMATKTKT